MIEYYPTLTINELSSHEKTWRNLKCLILSERRASLMAQLVKNLPEIWETWVLSLSWEDPLEEDMVTHSSILTGESSWTEEPRGLQFMVSQRIRYDWATKHIQVKEANLKRLPTIWFSLYDILGKAKLWRQWKDKWLPGARGEVGMNKWKWKSLSHVRLFATPWTVWTVWTV